MNIDNKRILTEKITGIIDALKGILGDVNSDGKVDTVDLAQLKLYLAGLTDLSEISKDGADINADGGIDTTDLASLKLKLAGL